MPDSCTATRIGRRVVGGSMIAALWVVAGCQSTTRIGDRYFETGRYPEAAAAYEIYLDSGPRDKDRVGRTLFRLGVIYSTPASPAYDPALALETIDQLLTSHPGGPYAAAGRLLRDLQLEVEALQGDLVTDRRRLSELETELARRQNDLVVLRDRLGEKDEAFTALADTIPPLHREIADLTRDLEAKEQELERLKAIDLAQPP